MSKRACLWPVDAGHHQLAGFCYFCLQLHPAEDFTADNFHGTLPDYFREAGFNPVQSKGRRADILAFWSVIKPEEKTSWKRSQVEFQRRLLCPLG